MTNSLQSRLSRWLFAVFVAFAWTITEAPAATVKKNAALWRDASSNRRIIKLAEPWKFMRGNPPNAAARDLDESTWMTVRVPHDWAISQDQDERADSNSKFNWRGEGWYRFHVTPSSTDENKKFYLDFDGVMAFPKVYVNGQLAGEWDYGYNSFRVDATPYLQFEQDNVIAVHVDTRSHGTRWYPGAGIYRKVSLVITDAVHIAQWGTFVTTPRIGAQSADVSVKTDIENTTHGEVHARLRTTIFAVDDARTPVASGEREVELPAEASAHVSQIFTVRDPRLWDLNAPTLYRAVSEVLVDGVVRDSYVTKFGIRDISFTSDKGLLLNGRRVQLKGANLHHDLGPLGAAFHRRAAERQLEIMRDMGVNAIRFSHNPAAPELLDMADEMGFLVYADCFDKWDQTADRLPQVELNGFAERQISQLVRRDRNHPSVMIWSIGNEIWDIEVNLFGGAAEQVGTIASFVRANDPTRPVTMATHLPQAINTQLHKYLDVQSWNYGRKYLIGRAAYPYMPLVMSESASAVSTRGEYQLPLPRYKDEFPKDPVLGSFDLSAVSWGDIADTEFANLDHYSYVAGEFVWTGFDYLGEPTPYERVSRSSYFGAVDLVGLPKDRFYLYRSHWKQDATTVHLLPHWNWSDRIGQSVPVMVYTNGDEAELFLNGRSLGRQFKYPQGLNQPPNLALAKLASASSEEGRRGNRAQQAIDGNQGSRWCAADGGANVWWQVDLGEVTAVRTVNILFEKEQANYVYQIQGSLDGETWQNEVAGHSQLLVTGAATHWLDTKARFLRVLFTGLKPGAWASIKEFEVYDRQVDKSYYGVTKSYRLRWDSVSYEPGELRAVAYRGGEKIGEARMVTAAPPTRLLLTADRSQINADGDDLSYLTLTAVDDHGTEDPLGNQVVSLELDGPGEIIGVGNGDPNSHDRMVDTKVRLFHGKAMVIVRSKSDAPGSLTVTAMAPGLETATSVIEAR